MENVWEHFHVVPQRYIRLSLGWKKVLAFQIMCIYCAGASNCLRWKHQWRIVEAVQWARHSTPYGLWRWGWDTRILGGESSSLEDLPKLLSDLTFSPFCPSSITLTKWTIQRVFNSIIRSSNLLGELLQFHLFAPFVNVLHTGIFFISTPLGNSTTSSATVIIFFQIKIPCHLDQRLFIFEGFVFGHWVPCLFEEVIYS